MVVVLPSFSLQFFVKQTVLKIYEIFLQATEKKLEIQAAIKQEMDSAVQSLEKELHDKMDQLTCLQQQLDEVKEINLNLQSQLVVCLYAEKYLPCYYLTIKRST